MTNPYDSRPGKNPWCVIGWILLGAALITAWNDVRAEQPSMEIRYGA